MNSYNSTVIERSNLTFCVEGLQAREELLFKAFVRLLDHLTHQKWSYHPPGANVRVDLLVVAENVEPTYSRNPGESPQPVLRLGSTGVDGHGVLSWPLKPDALEKELNRLGGQAICQRGVKDLPHMPPGAAGSAAAPDNTQELMRLQQWPPSRLLSGPGRMRLATLLTGKAMSLDELVYRSALPLPLCKVFVDDLKRAKLLQMTAAMPKAVSPERPVRPEIASPIAIARPKPVQTGLLDRIRMRLGIKSLAR